MLSKSRWMAALTCCGLALGVLMYVAAPRVAFAFADRNLMYGSVGYSVYELQDRLHFLGYYDGKISGVFDWKTYWAVRDFQYAFGMPVTGLVDMATKIRLVKATAAWHYHGPLPGNTQAGGGGASGGGGAGSAGSGGAGGGQAGAGQSSAGGQSGGTGGSWTAAAGGSAPAATAAGGGSSPAGGQAQPLGVAENAAGLSASDLTLMEHVVFAEAGDQPFIGQVAVADVLLNRLHSAKFPHSIPAIVYQPGAFQSVSNGLINQTPNASAVRAVDLAVQGWDVVPGALYYFNPATSTSSWIWSKPEITKIGQHIFAS